MMADFKLQIFDWLALSGWIPTTWTGFVGACMAAGILIGSVIAFYATRSERKKISEAHAETNRVYEQTIEAQKGFIDTLRATDKASLDVMIAERDGYKKIANDRAAELQAIALRIKEFELRPDLTTLYHAQQTWHEQREKFYTRMFDSQEKMLKTQEKMLGILQSLSDGVARKFAEAK